MNIAIFLFSGVLVGVLATYFSVKIENKITKKEEQIIENTTKRVLKEFGLYPDVK